MGEPSFFEARWNWGCWFVGVSFARYPWREFNILLGPLGLSFCFGRS